MTPMRTASVTAVIAALALAGAAAAHPATEQYIPIGQSPGPGVVQGTAEPVAEPAAGAPPIVAVDREGEQIGAYVVTPQTRIYIDRSAQGLPSTMGTLEDVQAGRVIEVRIADPETRAAEWIKVRAQ
jgi:hypothetical protein